MAFALDRAALDELQALLRPLQALGDADELGALLGGLGWDATALGLDPGALSTAVGALERALVAAAALAEQEEMDLADLARVLGPLAEAVLALVDAVRSIAAARALSDAVVGALAEDLAAGLVVRYLASRFPRVSLVLELLGVLRRETAVPLSGPDGRTLRAGVPRRTFDLAAVGALFKDPLDHLRRRFLTDEQGARRAATAVADLLGPLVAEGLVDCGLGASYGSSPRDGRPALTPGEADALSHLLVVDAALPAGGPAAPHLRVVAGLADDAGAIGLLVGASGGASLSLPTPAGEITATLTGAAQPLLLSSRGISLPSGGAPQLEASVRFRTLPRGATGPAFRLGAPDGTRLEVGGVDVTLRVSSDASGADLGGSLEVQRLVIALQGGDGDGFLASVLPEDPITLEADLGVEVGLRSGVRFHGSGSLEKTFTLGVSLGPLQIEAVTVGLRLSESGLAAEVTGALGIALGPVAASVEGLGLAARLTASAGGAGCAGPYDLTLGFRPPRGLGIAVDAGPVAGGGYLFFDPDRGQYAGVLQLEIQDTIAIKAVGLLSTRMPDGSEGFSLLFIITAEFPPIQLGFGFTLNGLGGLAGVNRTMVVPVLQAGIKNRTLGSILFPDDPVANAPRIISDLQGVFPVAPDRYVFGPMAMLGWGSPSILTIEVGIVLELPSPVRLVIMGRVKLALPPEGDETILLLQLDVLGAIDFGERTASIDASLFDSSVVQFAITGDMAMRLRWGDDPAFALSAGGFHPRFEPPPGFPALERLAISLATGDNPRLRLESYLAVTTGAMMMGARLDAYAKLDTFLGTFSASAYLAFDALVEFSPFHFLVELQGGASIARDGKPLLSADVYLALSGPEPWHAWGKATVHFLGEHDIGFDLTIGQEPARALPPPPDPLPMLRAALADPRSWAGQLPDGGRQLVTLRSVEAGEAVLVHPLGSLGVRQRVLPLQVTLARFGTVPLAAPARYEIAVLLGGLPAQGGEQTTDSFAPGQFLDLTEDQKLSRPAFEPFPSGLTGLTVGAQAASPACEETFAYETIVVDEPDAPRVADHPAGAVLGSLAELAAAAEGLGRRPGKAAAPPARLSVRSVEFAIARLDDLSRAEDRFQTYTQAEQARAASPRARDLQVVAVHEVEHV